MSVVASPKSSWATYGVCPTTAKGHGCVYEYQASVNDTAVDGHSTLIQYRWLGSTTYSLWDHDGANNGETTLSGIQVGSRTGFQSRICYGDWADKSVIGCGSWV